MCEGIMLVNMWRQTWAKGLSRAWPFLYMTTSSCGADRQVSLWSCTPTSCICGCMDVCTHAPPFLQPTSPPALPCSCAHMPHLPHHHPRFKGVTGVHSMVSVTSGELGGRTFPATIRRGKGEQVRLGRGLLALVQARLACLWHCMVVAWICV